MEGMMTLDFDETAVRKCEELNRRARRERSRSGEYCFKDARGQTESAVFVVGGRGDFEIPFWDQDERMIISNASSELAAMASVKALTLVVC